MKFTLLLGLLFIQSFQVFARLSRQVEINDLLLKRLPLRPLEDATFSCSEENGLFAIPHNCGNDYHVCIASTSYVSSCPAGEVFDPITLKCTPTKNASCNTTFTCPQPDGFFPIPGTCGNDFYSCVGGVVYPEKCPGNSVFDPEALICVPPENASCSATTTTEPTTARSTTISTTTSSFTCPSIDGFYAVPGECTGQYYVCISEDLYIQNCPGSSIFDPQLVICVPAPVASCAITTTTEASTTTEKITTTTTSEPTTTTTTTTTEPTTTTTSTRTTTTPESTTTTTTQERTTTTATTTTEPTTTVETTTVEPTSTTTEETTSPITSTTTTAQTTTTPATGIFVCPAPFGLYPVPGTTCSPDFYHCSNYNAYLKTCPATTYFNPSLEVCDYPENIPGCQ